MKNAILLLTALLITSGCATHFYEGPQREPQELARLGIGFMHVDGKPIPTNGKLNGIYLLPGKHDLSFGVGCNSYSLKGYRVQDKDGKSYVAKLPYENMVSDNITVTVNMKPGHMYLRLGTVFYPCGFELSNSDTNPKLIWNGPGELSETNLTWGHSISLREYAPKNMVKKGTAPWRSMTCNELSPCGSNGKPSVPCGEISSIPLYKLSKREKKKDKTAQQKN